MFAHHASHNTPLITALLPALLTLVCVGCASVTPRQSVPRSFAGMIPPVLQQGLSLAVWLEDQCENREADDAQITMLEALHDGIIVPTESLFAIGLVVVVGTAWSLYDRVMPAADLPLPNRPQEIWESVKPVRVGPLASRLSHRTEASIRWTGCPSISDDG